MSEHFQHPLFPVYKATKHGYPVPLCPECGAERLRHVLYSRWHECKACGVTWRADCSPHRHGGYLS